MRFAILSRFCVYCRAFHTHRVAYSRLIKPPVVVYATCPETKNTVHFEVPELS